MTVVAVSLLLAAHLLAMNVASVGPLVAIGMDWRNARGCVGSGRAGRALTQAALFTLVLGALLGLAAGWLLWSPDYGRAVDRLWSKVYFGIWELVFSFTLLGLNVALWRGAGPAPARRRLGRSLCAFLSATNLLYHFPPLLLVLSRLLRTAEAEGDPITSAEFRVRMVAPFILARSTHFWLASLAVTGMLLVLYHVRRREGDAPTRPVAIVGGRVALIATLLQVPAGIWVLATSPTSASFRLLGADPLATVAFGSAILLSLSLMHRLANIAFGDLTPRAAHVTGAIMVLVVTLMTFASRLAGA